MADMLAAGAAWLGDQLAAHAAQTVTYTRGDASVEVTATIGQTAFRVSSEFGSEIVRSRDFLIAAADLVLTVDPVEPAPGDRIAETDGDTVHTYEVLAINDEPCWRYSDPYRKTLRVHTKRIGSEAAP